MKYEHLRTEYLVLKDRHNTLALACGELIFYHFNEEKARWKDNENIYPLTIELLNCKDEKRKAELKDKIEHSLTYMAFVDLCKEYPEEVR